MNRDFRHEKTDDELLNAIRLNDEYSSFSAIYERYWDKSLAIAYNLTRDKSLAKDIVQDVFVSFWNRRKSLEINNFGNYIATAIKFSFYLHIDRERRRRVILEEKLERKAEAEADEQIEKLFYVDYFLSLIETLPEKCRLVVSYSKLHDMNNADIAQKMNISEKTVEGHLTKGLKIIQRKYKGDAFIINALYAASLFEILTRK
ncbi:MAG: polymerase sigma-70 factor [Bacteroidetes bacterium]|nr:polymerase sigma-70 factor [Bacteroidota bacterium]